MPGGLFVSRRVEVICPAACIVGESPVWLPEVRELAMCDVHGCRVRRIPWGGGAVRDVVLDDLVGSVVPEGTDGTLLVFLGKKVLRLGADGSTDTVAEDIPVAGIRFNDVRRGPDGAVWGGTYSRDATAGFYRFNRDWTFSGLLAGVGNSNGVVWDDERGFMWHIDTPRGTVIRYRCDTSTAELSSPETVRCFSGREGFPDGMCADGEGRLWIALWGAGKVICIDPDTGRELDGVGLPVSRPTCPVFAGDDRRTLVVTSAAHGVDLRTEPMAGSTFAVGI